MIEWSEVTLGEVMTLDLDSVDVEPDGKYDIVGVLNRGRGLLRRDLMPGSATAYKKLNKIRPRQVVYSKLKAFEGAITVAPNDLPESFASSEFPTFTCGPRLLPEYFALHTTTARFWDRLQGLSTGMGGRRERVKPADFLTIGISLPPLTEQRRIVDLVGSIDGQIAAVATELRSAQSVLSALRNDVPAATEVTISSIIEGIDSGKSVQASGAERAPGEPAVLKLSAVQSGSFKPGEAKRLDDVSAYSAAHLVSDGDLLITRASGSIDRVGYVAIAQAVPASTYMPDLIWRIRTNKTLCLPEFLSHLLSAPAFRTRITSTARGTASMRKINKRGFGAVMVPLPSLADQRAYVVRCDGASEWVEALSREVTSLRQYRSRVLASLLARELDIPDTYDGFLEVS